MKGEELQISTIVFGSFRLDGGAMFGSVPKNLWSKIIAVDDENCIPLVTRSLLIKAGSRKFLIDVGMGEKWSDKNRKIFAIKNNSFSDLNFEPSEITDVILTHLHFDHAGGITTYNSDQANGVELVFPSAKIHLQRANFENALNPSLRERASYRKENVEPLNSAKLNLVDGTSEIYPGITVHKIDGHTRGQQWVEIRSGSELYMFATDLIPTSRHVPLAYTMGYDICTETVLSEKKNFLDRAIQEEAIVVFQHDPDTSEGRIGLNEKGQYFLREKKEAR